jgi:hypothetical protein
MENFLNWLTSHWQELLAYIGLGAGGAVGAQKLRDKNQDIKLKRHSDAISDIDKRLNEMDKLIINVQNELAMNLQSDVNRGERMEEILSDLKEGQKQMHIILMELITGKIKLK